MPIPNSMREALEEQKAEAKELQEYAEEKLEELIKEVKKLREEV